MKKLGQICGQYLRDESGATAIEYGIIAAVIGVTIIAGASSVGKDTTSLWNQVNEAVGNVSANP